MTHILWDVTAIFGPSLACVHSTFFAWYYKLYKEPRSRAKEHLTTTLVTFHVVRNNNSIGTPAKILYMVIYAYNSYLLS